MGKWIIFPCTRCGAILIASEDQISKNCTSCNKSMHLHKMINTYVKDWRQTKPKTQRITKRSSIVAVEIIGTFETFEEASDAARYMKLPEELRDNEENYRSSMWN